jgi:hypothetical protein
MNTPQVSAAERRWVAVFAAIVLLLTSLPYLLGYAFQGSDFRFTGFVFGVNDGNSYIAKMLLGAAGWWRFRSPYAALPPQPGYWLFTFFILLGKLSAPPGLHEQLVALFHLARLLCGWLMIRATYDFIAFFVPPVRWRRLGLALAVLGGGLGWLLVLLGRPEWLGSLPLDMYSPETFGFLAIFGLPHLALARAGLLWTILAYLRMLEGGAPGLKSVVGLAAAWLLTGLGQPMTMAIAGLVIALHLLLLGVASWRRARLASAFDLASWLGLALRVVAAGLLPVLFLAYMLWLPANDTYIRLWSQQNRILSPHPLHYLAAYGLILPYVIAAIRTIWGRLRTAHWLLLIWLAALPLLVYAPLDIQRRLAEGAWVVLVTLAMLSLSSAPDTNDAPAAPSPSPSGSPAWAALPLLLAFPSALLLVLGSCFGLRNPSPPLFLPVDQVRVFEWLQTHADPDTVALAAFETGNALPAWAPMRVVLGHGPESVYYAQAQSAVQTIFNAASSDMQRQSILRQYGVRYLLWGPDERKAGAWQPDQASYLYPVFQSGPYSLFQVVLAP